MARYDDLDTQTVTVIGVCGAVGTFVIIVALQVLYYNYEAGEIARKVLAAPQTGTESVLSEQRSRLASYGWVDRQQQIVSVPIDEAMAFVVAREQRAVSKDSANAN